MIVPRLDKLPQELIDQIASEAVVYFDDEAELHFDDKLADLASLSRTCKRLHDACAPTLFRRVTFRWCDPIVVCFLRSLISKPYLRKYVQVFEVREWAPGRHEKNAIDKLPQVVKSDPVARLLLQEDPSALSLWDIVAALTLKLLPDLVALTTSTAVMQLVTRWPEEQRLQGSSISVLQVNHEGHQRSDNYCEDMFGWKQAFRPGSMPAALHSLHLHHLKCQAHNWRGTHTDHQFDLDGLHMAAFLRRLDLQLTHGERSCVARLMEALDKCTSLTHLTFIDVGASVKALLQVISKSTTLTANLQSFEIRTNWAQGRLDAQTLSQLSRLTHVTTLALPEIEIDVIDEDSHVQSKIWPPSLESLTLSVRPTISTRDSLLRTMLKARHLPASMQDVTLNWFLERNRCYYGPIILDLINFSQALDKDFASSGIALLHKHRSREDHYSFNPISASPNVNIEQEILIPMLRRYVGDGPILTDEIQARIDTILNGPSALS